MNHAIEKMYYQGREIVLLEKEETDESVISCHGCVLESENSCTRKIVPAQSQYVCAPRNTGVLYIFKYEEDG